MTEERFLQTLETINSIREYIPNSYIILFDNSNFNLFEKITLIKLTN
jgi:hypothetical protein